MWFASSYSSSTCRDLILYYANSIVSIITLAFAIYPIPLKWLFILPILLSRKVNPKFTWSSWLDFLHYYSKQGKMYKQIRWNAYVLSSKIKYSPLVITLTYFEFERVLGSEGDHHTKCTYHAHLQVLHVNCYHLSSKSFQCCYKYTKKRCFLLKFALRV
jgi:hypothetical protein